MEAALQMEVFTAFSSTGSLLQLLGKNDESYIKYSWCLFDLLSELRETWQKLRLKKK